MSEILIDGENAVLGRLASYAAKQALLGKSIVIVNAEKVIVTGKEKDIIENYKEKRAKGGAIQRGPLFPSSAEQILKRTIRGMLSYKQDRGRKALRRVLCYKGIPEKFVNVKKIKARGKKGVSLERISKLLGGK